MKILIIGNGGREHALAWKAQQSPLVKKIWVAPGNAGTAAEPKTENIDIAASDVLSLLKFAQLEKIDLAIVGPEIPLAAGVVDQFNQAKIPCFGPIQQAAQLETSKGFCKDFLMRHHIPIPSYAIFHDYDPALNYVKDQSLPIVIKADGLAAGKGVVIAETLKIAEQTLRDFLKDPGSSVVIEEFLQGEELSYIVMCDGKNVLPLATSQDHKRLYDKNQGPNTGGMGAYSPVNCTSELEHTILKTIIEPTLAGMAKEGHPYIGFLYAGLMISPTGQPKVLEFNCRLGDPEAQVILMRLKSDLITLCMNALQGQLHQTTANWESRAALGVVMAAKGYPAVYPKGEVIHGLNSITDPRCKVFHAGTTQLGAEVTTNGGRVLTVAALGNDLEEAHSNAYQAVQKISWGHCYYRSDIGLQRFGLTLSL